MHAYTDESCTNSHRYMLIGGIWMPKHSEPELRANIESWRTANRMMREMKFTKVSMPKIDEYKSFVDTFFAHDESRFNCIVVDSHIQDHKAYSDGDSELGSYKMYYTLLSRRVEPGHRYWFYLDDKTNRRSGRLDDLQKCINRWCVNNRTCGEYPVKTVEPRDSKKESLIQLADVLLGATAYRWNGGTNGLGKTSLANHVAERLGRQLQSPTPSFVKKFNIWHWKPRKVVAQMN